MSEKPPSGSESKLLTAKSRTPAEVSWKPQLAPMSGHLFPAALPLYHPSELCAKHNAPFRTSLREGSSRLLVPARNLCFQAEMMCSHSLWSLPPSQLSCEASNNTNTVVRNGGRNLPVSSWKLPHQADTKCFLRFQASAHLDLGVRAGQKLREMARREEEEEVKTKVRQIQ